MKKFLIAALIIGMGLSHVFCQDDQDNQDDQDDQDPREWTYDGYDGGLKYLFSMETKYYDGYPVYWIYPEAKEENPIRTIQNQEMIKFFGACAKKDHFWLDVQVGDTRGWVFMDLPNPFGQETILFEEISGDQIFHTINYKREASVMGKIPVYSTISGSEDEILFYIDTDKDKVYLHTVDIKKVSIEKETLAINGRNRTNRWYYITFKKQSGWIFGSYFYSDRDIAPYKSSLEIILYEFTSNFGI